MKKFWGLFAVAILGAAVLMLAGPASAEDKDDEKPKYAIKDVMQKAHRGDDALRTKLLAGKASDEEKETLIAMYTALGKNDPPKGEKEAWKKRTDQVLATAKAFVKEANAKNKMAYNRATNCMTCHRQFRAR